MFRLLEKPSSGNKNTHLERQFKYSPSKCIFLNAWRWLFQKPKHVPSNKNYYRLMVCAASLLFIYHNGISPIKTTVSNLYRVLHFSQRSYWGFRSSERFEGTCCHPPQPSRESRRTQHLVSEDRSRANNLLRHLTDHTATNFTFF
jgi:hypothetical protein